MTATTRARTKQKTVDTEYFSVRDLTNAFTLIIDVARAENMAALWMRLFRTYVEGNRIVAGPSGYKMPRLSPGSAQPAQSADRDDHDVKQAYDAMSNGIGATLLRFTDSTITLVAGANPAVRERFDRLHVWYARGTIDDASEWAQLLAYFKRMDD